MNELQNKVSARYSPPVSTLLTYGKIRDWQTWPGYLELGFTESHIPALIQMALDKDLNWHTEDVVEVYAPIHAVRTLGQLRAEAAVEPLITLFHEFDDDGGSDWVDGEVPQALFMVGLAALPPLVAYFQDEAHSMYPRLTALNGLQQFAEQAPDTRDDVIAVVMKQLEQYPANDPIFNAFIISTLMDLKATEALPLIERAYVDDRVDWSITGDWDDVQVEFGLKEPDPNKKRPSIFPFLNLFNENPDDDYSASPAIFNFPQTRKNDKKKVKRKQADKTRKMNRKLKKR